MMAARIISSVVAIFITIPIWLFLLHEVLERVQASELMWFLYWVYVPLNFLVAIVQRALQGGKS